MTRIPVHKPLSHKSQTKISLPIPSYNCQVVLPELESCTWQTTHCLSKTRSTNNIIASAHVALTCFALSLSLSLSPYHTERVDEHWCDNANTTLPSDLVQNINTAFTPSDITPSDVFIAASPLLLVSQALLVISVMTAVLSI